MAALRGAESVHHEFESVALAGTRDEMWAGFYAAYVLGRLGSFTTASTLARVLERVSGEPWAEAAADAVLITSGPNGL